MREDADAIWADIVERTYILEKRWHASLDNNKLGGPFL